MRSKTSVDQGRLIISGTGRAGTTFLVQLLTKLGFDTGYGSVDQYNYMDELARAGLEGPLVGPNTHYVMKSPFFCDFLDELILDYNFSVYTALVPVRNLFDAAESRRKIFYAAQAQGKDPLNQPGSLWKTTDPQDQEDKPAVQFHKLLASLVKFDIPFKLLDFPRLAVDCDYLYRSIYRILVDHGIGENEFMQAYNKVAKPHLISKL